MPHLTKGLPCTQHHISRFIRHQFRQAEVPAAHRVPATVSPRPSRRRRPHPHLHRLVHRQRRLLRGGRGGVMFQKLFSASLTLQTKSAV
jgi:hypothetical protein